MSMVRDAQRFNAKLARMPKAVEKHVRAAMEKQAAKIAATMQGFAPDFIRIGWNWGDAPQGAVALHSFGGGSSSQLRITIHAIAVTTEYPQGHTGVPRWFEFGTGGRVQKSTGRYTGRITAQPFFYPGFRLNKKAAASAIKRAMKKGIREAAGK